MLQDLKAITLFVKTVELGSFRACADYFHLSPSVVSQQIAQLESRYGVALLYRSTRKLIQTEEGRFFYQTARQMVAAAEDSLNHLGSDLGKPVGSLVIAFSTALISSHFHDHLAAFIKTYPDIQMDIRYGDQRVDLLEDKIDLAIRVGKMPDSALKSKKLGQIERKLVAHPDLLAKFQLPETPMGLQDWPWIRMRMMPAIRPFLSPAGALVEVPHASTFQVDSVFAMTEFTRAAVGLSTPPDFLIKQDLQTGQLLELFPDWTAQPMDIHAVWHSNIKRKNLIALFIDWMAKI